MVDAFDGLLQLKSASPLLFDTGDHPNGAVGSTEATGTLITSGNARLWDITGYASFVNGAIEGPNTIYLTLRNTQTLGGATSPITSIGGVFTLLQDSGSGMPMCLFGRDETGTGLDNLTPHINFGSQGYGITQRIGGGSFITLTTGSWKGGPLPVGEPLAISCDYDYTGSGTTTIFMPDGTTLYLPSQCQTTLPPDGCWEVVSPAIGPIAAWNKLWSGKSDAWDFRAMGNGASTYDLNDLKEAVSQLHNVKLGSTTAQTNFLTFTMPYGGQQDAELIVDIVASVVSSSLPGVCSCYRKIGIPVLSNGGANILGTPSYRLIDSDFQDPSWTSLGIDFTPAISISSGIVTIGAVPALSGPNQIYVSGVKYAATGHDVGEVGGSWRRL